MIKFYWQIGSIFSILVLNTFLSIDLANARSCDYPSSPLEAMKLSSRTFMGKVLSIKDNGNSDLTIEFAVRRIWKGKKQSRITVHSSSPHPVAFEVGEKYLIYTNTSIEANEEYEYANLCSLSSKLNEVKAAKLRTLGKGRLVR